MMWAMRLDVAVRAVATPAPAPEDAKDAMQVDKEEDGADGLAVCEEPTKEEEPDVVDE